MATHPDYTYGEMDVLIGHTGPPTAPSPIRVPLRFALVDFARVSLLPLWATAATTVDAFVARALAADEDAVWPKTPYAGLKLVCNGTFDLGPAPAGHLVGRGRADMALATHEARYWTTLVRADARWFVGIDRTTGVVSVDRGGQLGLPPPPQDRVAWLKARFRMLLHGGAILFDGRFDPDNLTEAQYIPVFNGHNDHYNGHPAYGGMDTAAGTPRAAARWAIGLLGGTRVVVASTQAQVIYGFARALHLARFGTERARVAVLFDGGSHHGFHACRDLGDVIGRGPSEPAQHPQTRGTTCHFGVFQLVNVGVRRVAAERVPRRYRLSETVLSVRLRRGAEPLQVTVAVTSSDFHRSTQRVRVGLMMRRLQGQPAVPGGLRLERLWDVDSRHHGRDLVWTLSGDDTRKVVDWSDADPLGLVCDVASLDGRGPHPNEIARHEVGLRLSTAVQTVLVLDDSAGVGDALRAARDRAALMTAAEALARAGLRAADGTPLGLPTRIAVVGVNLVATTHLGWSDDLAAVRRALAGLGGPNGPDWNAGVRELDGLFSPPAAGSRRSALVFAAGPHAGGRPFRWNAVDRLRRDDVRVGVLAAGTADRAWAERLAGDTGGAGRVAASADEVVKLWGEAFAADLGDVWIRSVRVAPAPGATHVEPVPLRGTGVASVQVHWDSAQAAPEVGLRRPDTGERIDATNVEDHPDVTLVSDAGFAIFLVVGPGAAVTSGREWEVVVTAKPRRGEAELAPVFIAAREEPRPPDPDPPLVLVDPRVPESGRAGVDVPVSVRVVGSVPATRVFVLGRGAGQPEFTAFPLAEATGNVWQGAVPGALAAPGELHTYFRAEGEGKTGLAPRDAPASSYRTRITAETSPPVVWVAEYGREVAKGWARFHVSALDARGAPVASAGAWLLPAVGWPTHSVRLHGTFLADPGDAGLWLSHAPAKAFLAPPVGRTLSRIDSAGRPTRVLTVPPDFWCHAVDPARGWLWGVPFGNAHQVLTVDAASGKTTVRVDAFNTLDVALDRAGTVWVSGYSLAGGPPGGIFHLVEDGRLEPFHAGFQARIRSAWFLNPLADGGLVCFVGSPGLPRIARLDPRGQVTHESEALTGANLHAVQIRADGSQTWTLLRLGPEQHQVRCYGRDLQEQSRLGAADIGVRFFDSIAADPAGDGLYVSGDDGRGRGFVARVDPDGGHRILARLRGPAVLAVAGRGPGPGRGPGS